MTPSVLRFLHHTQRRTTVGTTPLDERLARRRDLWQHTTFATKIHAPGGIRNHNFSRRAAAELCFRPADLSNTTPKLRTAVMFVSTEWSKHFIQRLWSMQLFPVLHYSTIQPTTTENVVRASKLLLLILQKYHIYESYIPFQVLLPYII
jgi:hypothetical protein